MTDDVSVKDLFELSNAELLTMWRHEKAHEIEMRMDARRVKKEADMEAIDRTEACEQQKLRVDTVRLVMSFRLMGRDQPTDKLVNNEVAPNISD